jgi:hypothetical protein
MLKNRNKKNKKMEYRTNKDGTPNKKYVDVLDVDNAISGQKFACLSFISPEKEIKQRELYFFNEYVKDWDMKKSLEKYTQFLNFISFKHNIDFNLLETDFGDFCRTEKDNLFSTTLADEYKTFLDNNEDKLMEKYNSEVSFQTSVRGIKVRGSYPTQEEAELRCKMLREIDPTHDVYVGPVGSWMPFHPEAYKTGRVEYMEEELNQLMHEKDKNEKQASAEFEKRVKESKKKAMEENKRKAIESNNPLTQMLNENGDLVGVANASTVETSLGDDNVAVADIRKELFEGDNIVMDKDDDHGLSELTVVKELKKKNNKMTIEISEQEDESKKMVLNDEDHKEDCEKATCTLPEFKKCVPTGKKGEIICECMVDKDEVQDTEKNDDKDEVRDTVKNDDKDEVAC